MSSRNMACQRDPPLCEGASLTPHFHSGAGNLGTLRVCLRPPQLGTANHGRDHAMSPTQQVARRRNYDCVRASVPAARCVRPSLHTVVLRENQFGSCHAMVKSPKSASSTEDPHPRTALAAQSPHRPQLPRRHPWRSRSPGNLRWLQYHDKDTGNLFKALPLAISTHVSRRPSACQVDRKLRL